MKTSQKGFTLVELVVVIVLLGILGVTALGKFQDLSDDAEDAAVEGVASELSAASSINYAQDILDTTATDIVDLNVANVCTAGILGGLFQSGSVPGDYLIGGTGDCSGGQGESADCTVYKDNDGSAGLTGGDTQATANLICTD